MQENYQNSLTIMFFFALFFIIEFLFLFRTEFYSLDILNSSSVMFLSEFLQNSLLTQDFNNFWAVFSNLKVLSMALFSDYLYPILIASYVLLLAMVAVISLTLHKNFISKKQNIYSQILANYKNTVVNYS